MTVKHTFGSIEELKPRSVSQVDDGYYTLEPYQPLSIDHSYSKNVSDTEYYVYSPNQLMRASIDSKRLNCWSVSKAYSKENKSYLLDNMKYIRINIFHFPCTVHFCSIDMSTDTCNEKLTSLSSGGESSFAID